MAAAHSAAINSSVCVGEGEARGEERVERGRGRGTTASTTFLQATAQQQQPPPPNAALLLATDSSHLGVGSTEINIQKYTEGNCR